MFTFSTLHQPVLIRVGFIFEDKKGSYRQQPLRFKAGLGKVIRGVSAFETSSRVSTCLKHLLCFFLVGRVFADDGRRRSCWVGDWAGVGLRSQGNGGKVSCCFLIHLQFVTPKPCQVLLFSICSGFHLTQSSSSIWSSSVSTDVIRPSYDCTVTVLFWIALVLWIGVPDGFMHLFNW